jgi:hypothetical protein
MNGKIGADKGATVDWQAHRMAKMAQLAHKAGVKMTALDAGLNLPSALAAKIGQATGMMVPGQPDTCDTPQDPRVFQSIMLAMANGGPIIANPPGSGLTDAQWLAIVTAIRANEFCPSPRRVGWQCDTITIDSSNDGSAVVLAPGATATITVTSSKAFCSSALVAAVDCGDLNETRFDISSILINGDEQVVDGPWNSELYTSSADCCLCAKEFPIVEAGSDIVFVVTNMLPAAAANANDRQFRAELFGKKLFC